MSKYAYKIVQVAPGPQDGVDKLAEINRLGADGYRVAHVVAPNPDLILFVLEQTDEVRPGAPIGFGPRVGFQPTIDPSDPR